VEAVKFMTAFWKDSCDEGGLAWDDTNNNRAFLAGEICGSLKRGLDLHRAMRALDKDQDEKGEPMVRDSSTPACLRVRPARRATRPLPPRGHELREKQKRPRNCLSGSTARSSSASGSRWRKLLDRLDQDVGAGSAVEHDDEPMKAFRTGADNSRTLGYAGPPVAKATEVY